MNSLYDDFNLAFDNLIAKFEECFLSNQKIFNDNNKFPIENLIERISKISMASFLNISTISKYLLCSDMLNIIRQGLILDKKIIKNELLYTIKFVHKLYGILGEIRECYSEFCKTKEDQIYETIKFWHQDSDLFGFANNETKHLLRNLIAHLSLKTNNPDIFFEYKSLVIGVYSAIVKINSHSELIKKNIKELSENLDIVFVKDFYTQVVSEITKAKILKRHNLKEYFSIDSIDLIPELKINLNTTFESRTSFENLTPYISGSNILAGAFAVMFDPWQVNLVKNNIIEPTEFSYIVPNSRRWSDCNKCKGTQVLACSECNGQKRKSCSDCMEGDILCTICNGSGEVSFIETFEKLVIGQDGLSLSTVSSQRTKKKPCVPCLTKGKVQCPTCNGSKIVLCKLCSGQGQIKCKICDGIGKVEYNQTLIINRTFKNIEKTLSFITGKDLEIKCKNHFFTKIKTLKGVNLCQNVLLEKFGSNILNAFLNSVYDIMHNEWVESVNLKPILQYCEIYISYTYMIHFSFFGYKSKAYWYPSFNSESFIKNGVINSLLQSFASDVINKKHFNAAKKFVYMENISKRNSDCLEIIQNQYKNLSLRMKFLIYVARHFVNPESIW